MAVQRRSVSIICVFNDPEVRERCLDRSIEDLRHEATDVEYLPIDNVHGQFGSAAAALNHGASLARHDYFVFVHQDVYLHSLAALERAAGMLAEGDFGLLGAIGVTADGAYKGRIRDRIVLLGDPAPEPVDVDSLDEVLFMISRTQLEAEPLADCPALAWHAYAVEYGLRMRGKGLRVGAVDIPLTHNSLTINLDRLDVAHGEVASRHPESLPIRTTCGTVGDARLRAANRRSWLASYRWRYRWLKESLDAHSIRRAAGGGRLVLSDIRRDVDDLLELIRTPRLQIINLDRTGTFGDARSNPLDLVRRNHHICATSMSMAPLAEAVRMRAADTSLLLTNLEASDVRALAEVLPRSEVVLGVHGGIGAWALVGPATGVVGQLWTSPQTTPLRVPLMVG